MHLAGSAANDPFFEEGEFTKWWGGQRSVINDDLVVKVTQLKASEQMHAVASEEQQKEANIKEALEEQLAQVQLPKPCCRSDRLQVTGPRKIVRDEVGYRDASHLKKYKLRYGERGLSHNLHYVDKMAFLFLQQVCLMFIKDHLRRDSNLVDHVGIEKFWTWQKFLALI